MSNKISKPEVKPGDWIKVGDNVHAVVTKLFDEELRLYNFGDMEVVYLDYRNRAISNNVIWDEGSWKFTHQGAGGGYADKYSHLSKFVNILRQGRFYR